MIYAIFYTNITGNMSYEEVLPSTPKYDFKGIQDCLRILEQPCEEYEGYTESVNPYIIFTIDERPFLDCFANGEESPLRKSWESYDPSLNELLVKRTESGPHAIAVGVFTDKFLEWRGPVDDNYPLTTTTTKPFRGSLGQIKRADCAWTPTHSDLDRKWPSIVVEVVWSEPRGKLIRDVKFWLSQSYGKVNIILTITVSKCGNISIEQWKTRGATPVPVQTIEITRTPPPKCERVQGSMRLAFEDIHLRPKGKNDTDFIISHRDMEIMARQIWDEQFGSA
jgi:hypothetical protein